MLTLYQFNSLDEHAKGIYLFECGERVADRREGNSKLLLYQADAFYVELHYDGEKNQTEIMRTFSDPDQLEPYLREIEVSGLLLQT